jgi:carbon monoxide dehydrogenase subunit G
MIVSGEHRFQAPRQKVWEALLDPDVLAGTLPGFQGLEQVGENEFAGSLALGVGPVQGRFEGRVELSDLTPPSAYRLKMSGRGAPGHVEGNGQVELEEDGQGTRMRYEVDVRIGGRIAGVGQRLLEMTARTLTRQALASLARRIELPDV